MAAWLALMLCPLMDAGGMQATACALMMATACTMAGRACQMEAGQA